MNDESVVALHGSLGSTSGANGNGTYRPRSVSATIFGRNVPNFMDVSATKCERFGQQI